MIGSTASNVILLVFASILAVVSVYAWWSIRQENRPGQRYASDLTPLDLHGMKFSHRNWSATQESYDGTYRVIVEEFWQPESVANRYEVVRDE